MIELLITILLAFVNPTTPTTASSNNTATQAEQTETLSAFGGTSTWVDK